MTRRDRGRLSVTDSQFVSASCLGWPLFHRTTPTQPRLTIFETKAPMPVPNHQRTTPLGLHHRIHAPSPLAAS